MDICLQGITYLGWLGSICRVVEREQFGARFFEPPSNGLGLRVGGPQYAPHSPIDVLKDGHRLSRVVFLDDRLRQDCAKGQNHVVVGPTVARDGDLFAKYFFGLSEASKTAVGSCQIYCGIDRLPIGSAWRVVEVEKVVTKACSDASIYNAVEAQDTVKCFDACGARNTSSPCWIGCFYRTILGAEGMLPTGAAYPGGMPYDALAQAWEAPFASSDPSRGRCPAVAVPDMTGTRPGVVSVSRRRRRLVSRGR